MNAYRLLKSRKSQVFFIVAIVLTTVLGLIAALLLIGRAHTRFVGNQGDLTKALHLARAGIKIALPQLEPAGDGSCEGGNGDGGGDLADTTYYLGAGEVTVGAANWVITSAGKVGKSERVLTKTVPTVSGGAAVTTWAKAYSVTNENIGYLIRQTTDGGFMLGGYINDGSDMDIVMFKLNADGTPDTNFNGNGIMTFGGFDRDDETDEAHESFCETPTATNKGYILGGKSDSFSTSGKGGGSGYDFLVVKITDSETVDWERVYRGSKDDALEDIEQVFDASSNLEAYIMGGYSPSWTGAQNAAVLFKVDPANGTPMGSTYSEALRFGDYGVRQYNLTGAVLFNNVQQIFTGSTPAGYIIGAAMAENPPGSSYNGLIIKTNTSGGKIWAQSYGPNDTMEFFKDVQQTTNESGYIAVGLTNETDGFDKGLVIKIFDDGTVDWAMTYDEDTNPEVDTDDRFYAVQETGDGYILGGYSQQPSASGDKEFFVVKINFDGEILWSRLYGSGDSSSPEELHYIDEDANEGGFLLSGETGTSTWGVGSTNALVIKIDANGDLCCQDEPSTTPDLNIRQELTINKLDRTSTFAPADLTDDITDTQVSFDTIADPDVTVEGPDYTITSICINP